MKNINAYPVRALVALVLLSLLAPMTGLAQNATPVAETPTPTEVVTDPDAEVIEAEETSTPEATVEAAPSGQRMAPAAEAPPLVTLFGSTEPATVPRFFWVRPETPAEAELGEFSRADCSGEPEDGWFRGIGVSPSTYTTIYFQARWKDDDSTRGNCLAVTWEPVSEPVLATKVCGNNNDVVTPPKVQTGISFTDTGWVNNERTITLVNDARLYSFSSNQQTVYVFEDDGPCEPVTPIPPVHTEICGTNNDVISFASDQPAGVIVDQSESWNEDSTWTVNFTAATGYIFPVDTTTQYLFEDEGPCETGAPIPPVQTEVCGTNNDVISFPSDQPTNVNITQSEDWSPEGAWTVTFAAAEGYVLPVDTETEYVFTDEGPCETGVPIPPVQTEICGTNNDVISFPSDQPENVIVTQSEAWNEDGAWGVTFTAAEHYKLPLETRTEYIFTDAAIPCPTDAPAPPVQSAVCGPDNDLITIPDDQPEGITLDSDSGWENNTRTITFAVAPDFQTDGPTSFTFTDAGEPCPIPTTHVTIQMQTSDGGSIAGSPWQLYAPLAAQISTTDPYMEGTVGAGNQIVLEELIAGQYRLVVNADGYEVLDETFTIEEEEDDRIISIRVTAIQVPAGTPTPTPVTTPVPSAAGVTGLPNTGSGSGVSGITYTFGLMLIAAGTGAFIRRQTQ